MVNSRPIDEPILKVITSEGEIFFSAGRCTEARRALQSMKSWQKKLDGFSCEVKLSELNDCQSDISDCLPVDLKKQHNSQLGFDGPNCFNAALNALGYSKCFHQSTDKGIRSWVTSPLCEEVKSPKPGDLELLESKNGALIHASIWVSNNLSFSKNNMISDTSPRLQSRWNLWPYLEPCYGKCKKCEQDANPQKYEEFCEKNHPKPKLKYYRCDSIDDFLQNETNKDQKEWAVLLRARNQFICHDNNPISQKYDTTSTLTDSKPGVLPEEILSLIHISEPTRPY